MMATTHGFMGSLFAIPFYFVAPELFIPILLATFLGGAFPDLDLYYKHRKLFHYPVHYNIAWLVLLPVVVIFPSVFSLAMFFFLLSAGLHCYIDRFGGPKDSRPWKHDSGKAVYSHYHEKWWSPSRIIPYDGSWQDLLLLVLVASPVIYLLENNLQSIAVVIVVLSGFYTAFRKKGMEILPDIFFRSEPDK